MTEMRVLFAIVFALSGLACLVIGLVLTGRTVVWLVQRHEGLETFRNQVNGLCFVLAASIAHVAWLVTKP